MNNRKHRYYEFGEFRLDAYERLLLRNGETIPLTFKVFDVLLVLLEHGLEAAGSSGREAAPAYAEALLRATDARVTAIASATDRLTPLATDKASITTRLMRRKGLAAIALAVLLLAVGAGAIGLYRW